MRACKFYGSLGNHDSTSERFYKPFNMNGQQYYTYKKGNVQFFVLDSNYMNPSSSPGWRRSYRTQERTGKSVTFITRFIRPAPFMDLRPNSGFHWNPCS